MNENLTKGYLKMIISSLTILSLSILSCCNSAPTTYDQRQDGQTNVRGGLENFVFLLMPSSSIFNDVSLFNFRSMARQLIDYKNKKLDSQEPILSIKTDDDELDDRTKIGQPYQVNIVKIPKDKETNGLDLDDFFKKDNRLKNLKNVPDTIVNIPDDHRSFIKDKEFSSKKDDDERKLEDRKDLDNKAKDELQETKLK